MPELPEVEHLRRSLEPWLVGGRLGGVTIGRRDVIDFRPVSEGERGDGGRRGNDDESNRKRRGSHRRSRPPSRDRLESALLAGTSVIATHRHGKQLAIEADSGAVLVVQLGMTGSLAFEVGPPPRGIEGRHRHLRWEFSPRSQEPASESPNQPQLANGPLPWRFVFRDPRRFGGVTCYPSIGALREAWNRLGPDALTIDARALKACLDQSRRPIKSALLDQDTVAGIGNIYADESLYAAKIHPLTPSGSLAGSQIDALATAIRRILSHAVNAGGSTLRDYRDAFGRAGEAVQSHQAYGRAGLPCTRCGARLEHLRLSGRSTTFCPGCQRSTYPHPAQRGRLAAGR